MAAHQIPIVFYVLRNRADIYFARNKVHWRSALLAQTIETALTIAHAFLFPLQNRRLTKNVILLLRGEQRLVGFNGRLRLSLNTRGNKNNQSFYN